MSDSEGGGMPFNLQGLMQKAREMQEKLQAAQEHAERVVVEGQSGGGMVVARANGRGVILRVTIEPTLLSGGDKELLEDLVAAAVNQALTLAREAMQQEMSKATGGLPIPSDLSRLF